MIFQSFLIACGGMASLLICFYALGIGKIFRLLDVPDPMGGRKRHTKITPLVGGIAILVPTLCVGYLSILNTSFPGTHTPRDLNMILLLILAMFVVGIIDDRWALSAKIRLVVSVIGAVIAVLHVPDLDLTMLAFSGVAKPYFLGGYSTLFSALCLVGLLNAVNMADGKNGLVMGCCSFWTMFLIVYAPDYLRPLLITLLISLVITLQFNLTDKLFLGDGGSYGLSMLLGLLSIYVYNHRYGSITADQIVLWYMLPVIDCVRLLITRYMEGRSPFLPDRSHLHHYMALHLTWDRAKYLYWGMVGVPGALSILWPKMTPGLILAMLILYAVSLFYFSPLRTHPLAHVQNLDNGTGTI